MKQTPHVIPVVTMSLGGTYRQDGKLCNKSTEQIENIVNLMKSYLDCICPDATPF
ncbi:MAG: hypothetical protein JHC41_08995 [Nitrosopumilus sp.]|nr:hypothetical protein [Nitrosopumilus sp.]